MNPAHSTPPILAAYSGRLCSLLLRTTSPLSSKCSSSSPHPSLFGHNVFKEKEMLRTVNPIAGKNTKGWVLRYSSGWLLASLTFFSFPKVNVG